MSMFFAQFNTFDGFAGLGELGATKKPVKKTTKKVVKKTAKKAPSASGKLSASVGASSGLTASAKLSGNLRGNNFVYQATGDFTGYWGIAGELELIIKGAQGWTDYFSNVTGVSQVNGNKGHLQITGVAIASEDETDVKTRIDRMMSNYFTNIQSSVSFGSSSAITAKLSTYKKPSSIAKNNDTSEDTGNVVGDSLHSLLGGLGQGFGFGTPVVLLAALGIGIIILKK